MVKTRHQTQEEEKSETVATPPATRPKRRSDYSDFVKQVYHTEPILKLPVRERFKAISILWKAHKEQSK